MINIDNNKTPIIRINDEITLPKCVIGAKSLYPTIHKKFGNYYDFTLTHSIENKPKGILEFEGFRIILISICNISF